MFTKKGLYLEADNDFDLNNERLLSVVKPSLIDLAEFLESIVSLIIDISEMSRVDIPIYTSGASTQALQSAAQRVILSLGLYRDSIVNKELAVKRNSDFFHRQFEADLQLLVDFARRFRIPLRNIEQFGFDISAENSETKDNGDDFARFVECSDSDIEMGNKLLILLLAYSEQFLGEDDIKEIILFLSNLEGKKDVSDMTLSQLPEKVFNSILRIKEKDPNGVGNAFLGHALPLEAFYEKSDDSRFIQYNAINVACNNADLDMKIGCIADSDLAKLELLLNAGRCSIDGVSKQMRSKIISVAELNTALTMSSRALYSAESIVKILSHARRLKFSEIFGLFSQGALENKNDLRIARQVLDYRIMEEEKKYRVTLIKKALNMSIKNFIEKFTPRPGTTKEVPMALGFRALEFSDEIPMTTKTIPTYEPSFYPFGKEKSLLLLSLFKESADYKFSGKALDFIQINDKGEVIGLHNFLFPNLIKNYEQIFTEVIQAFPGLTEMTILLMDVEDVKHLSKCDALSKLKKIRLKSAVKLSSEKSMPYVLLRPEGYEIASFTKMTSAYHYLKNSPVELRLYDINALNKIDFKFNDNIQSMIDDRFRTIELLHQDQDVAFDFMILDAVDRLQRNNGWENYLCMSERINNCLFLFTESIQRPTSFRDTLKASYINSSNFDTFVSGKLFNATPDYVHYNQSIIKNREVIFQASDQNGFGQYNSILVKSHDGEVLYHFRNISKPVFKDKALEVTVRTMRS